MWKRALSCILVICLAFMFFVPAHAEEQREIRLSKAGLIACGYTSDRADKILDALEKGEPLTPFHEASYEDYNSPADENGLDGDTLLLSGSVIEYVRTEDVIGFKLQQEDGNIWLVACAIKNGIGRDRTGKGTVFDNLEGEEIELYCKYIGFSEKFKLPTVDITEYGGVLRLDNLRLIQTMTAYHNMGFGHPDIPNLGVLIGAKTSQTSFERYQPGRY